MRMKLAPTALAMCLAAAFPGAAWAQDGDLGAEIQQKYDAALAATLDPAIVQANDTRYLWASEAKVQCGIALGFLKSGTEDETSISKCRMAYDLMLRPPAALAPPPPPPPPPPPAAVCSQPGMVFFDFDSAELSSGARETIDAVAVNARPCNWQGISVVGHADRSGSNSYNIGLSQRRAQAVAGYLASRGVPSGIISTDARGEEQPRVPTADGVREPQNRRVEVGVR